MGEGARESHLSGPIKSSLKKLWAITSAKQMKTESVDLNVLISNSPVPIIHDEDAIENLLLPV